MNIRTLTLVAGAALAGSAAAQAPLFAFDSVTSNYVEDVSLTYNAVDGQIVDVSVNSSSREVWAGIITADVDGVANKLLCVELDQNTAPVGDPKTYQLYDPRGVIGQLVNQIDSVASNTDRAALQLAAWEIAYDYADGNAIDLTAGSFLVNTANAATIAKANDFLAAISFSNKEDYFYYGSAQYQDFVGAVPEPGTLLALGLGSLIALRRRKKTEA